MTQHTPIPEAPARPTRETQVCLACSAGDHEQVLFDERCPCPCHPAQTAEGEVQS